MHAFLLLVTAAEDETDLAELLPNVTMFVHTYAGPDREDLVRVDGHGPLTEAWLRQVLGPHARFTIQPGARPGRPGASGWHPPDPRSARATRHGRAVAHAVWQPCRYRLETMRDQGFGDLTNGGGYEDLAASGLPTN